MGEIERGEVGDGDYLIMKWDFRRVLRLFFLAIKYQNSNLAFN